MGDCHSSDPGSNPGPGALSSVRIPTSIIADKNNKEHINSETATISIVQQQKNIISRFETGILRRVLVLNCLV